MTLHDLRIIDSYEYDFWCFDRNYKPRCEMKNRYDIEHDYVKLIKNNLEEKAWKVKQLFARRTSSQEEQFAISNSR